MAPNVALLQKILPQRSTFAGKQVKTIF